MGIVSLLKKTKIDGFDPCCELAFSVIRLKLRNAFESFTRPFLVFLLGVLNYNANKVSGDISATRKKTT